MTSAKQVLLDFDLGSSVAEFDDQLENYFVQNQPFRDLITGRKDIVSGDKGTGKTAIFRYLYRKHPDIPELQGAIVLPAFNPSGSPIFTQLVERGRLSEAEYAQLWKAFVLSLVGNWLLKDRAFARRARGRRLDQLLRGLELRSEADGASPIFQKILAKIGGLFRWKSAEVGVQTSPEGSIIFVPKVEFSQDGDESTPQVVAVDAALRLLDDCLGEAAKSVWVAIDRLDEAFQDSPDIEIPALRALFRSYLDLIPFERIRLKLFVRADLFRRIVDGGFVNLTHINARTVDVIWDEEDLISLLCRRVRRNVALCDALSINDASDKAVFERLFPKQVDQGKRKADTRVWIMSRIRDGNGIKPPRNLIDLVSFAIGDQLRREDRDPRTLVPNEPLFEPDSLRGALTQLSERRVNDTLLAEARSLAPIIEKFRKRRSEHNLSTLTNLIGGKGAQVKDKIEALVQLGFLEKTGQTYKVPMLYRGGLEMTQGKAFNESSDEDDDA